VGAALICADGRTDKRTDKHDEANRPFGDYVYKSAPESDNDFFCEIWVIFSKYLFVGLSLRTLS
jgi:hypothetical protein